VLRVFIAQRYGSASGEHPPETCHDIESGSQLAAITPRRPLPVETVRGRT